MHLRQSRPYSHQAKIRNNSPPRLHFCKGKFDQNSFEIFPIFSVKRKEVNENSFEVYFFFKLYLLQAWNDVGSGQ